jgi:hypothetical protein
MTADRNAINRAFWALGLRFQWNEQDWAVLGALPDLRAQLRHYLPRHQPHLLAVYDVDFLGRLVEERISTPDKLHFGLEAPRSL